MCHVLRVSSQSSSLLDVKLGMSVGGFVERRLVVSRGGGLANLLVYGSTLLFQGQR